MPLTNTMLPLLTVMDPVFLSHQQTASSFQRLDSFMPSYTTDNKLMGKLASETNKYNEDADIKQLADDFNPAENIDTDFWMKVFTLESFNKPMYPAMKSLVTACSPNHDIQWSACRVQFQHHGRYCEKDRASLTVKNYEAVTIVKCTLRKRNLKTHKTKVDSTTKCSCINAYSTYWAHLQKKGAETASNTAEINCVCASTEGWESHKSTETAQAEEMSTWQKTTWEGLKLNIFLKMEKNQVQLRKWCNSTITIIVFPLC